MKPLDLAILREAVGQGRISWRRHVLERLAERGMQQQAIREVLLKGDKIRDYAQDRPFPSALFLGYIGGTPFHVVAACDEINREAFVITAYEPSLEVFESDYRTKKKL